MSEYFDETQNRVSQGDIARSADVNTLRDEVGAGFDKLPSASALNQNRLTYVTDTGAANAYAVALPATITAYTEGLRISFKATNTNTGASTLNVDAVGPIGIKRPDGSDLVAGDITAGQALEVVYDGTNFRFMGSVPQSFYDDVDQAVSDALTAQAGAETAETNASGHESDAASYASAAFGYRNTAETHKNDAEAAQTAAEAAQTAAENAEGLALQYALSAEEDAGTTGSDVLICAGSANTATNAATAAQTAQGLAEDAQTAAEVAQAAAEAAAPYGEVVADSGAAVSIDLAAYDFLNLTLNVATTTVSFVNPPAAPDTVIFVVEATQDATGGRAIIWPGTVIWPNGTAPTISDGAGDKDVFVFATRDGGTTYYGFVAGVQLG